MEKFEFLYKFLDIAVKNRKYARNTAFGLKAALKLFETEINDEERDSLDKFKDNLEQIYQNVVAKNKTIQAHSLETYRSRVLKVLHDYGKYGLDPAKIVGWIPRRNIRQKKVNVESSAPAAGSLKTGAGIPSAGSDNLHRIELSLGSGRKCLIVAPRDITAEEIKILRGVFDSIFPKN